MSHSTEDTRDVRGTDRAELVSGGNSVGLSVALFAVLFIAFVVGLYVMSLFTPVLFIVGLAIILVSLFGAFTLVPALLR